MPKCRCCGEDAEELKAELAYYRDLFNTGPDPTFIEWGASPGASAVLSMLMKRKGKPVAKFTLVEAIHNQNRFGHEAEPKILDVYVCRLRKILTGRGMRIKTIWGFGYQLEDGEDSTYRPLRDAPRGNMRRWTKEEIEKLRNSPSIMGAAEMLNRTPHACVAKAAAIGHRWGYKGRRRKSLAAA